MAYRLITQPDEAATELFNFVMENPSEFPDDMRVEIMRLLRPGGSVAFAVSESAEMIFARKAELSNDVVKLGAILAGCASYNKINNFADDDGERGRGIAAALRRHSKEKAPIGETWPPKEDDPLPKRVYLPEDKQDEVPTLEASRTMTPPPEPVSEPEVP